MDTKDALVLIFLRNRFYKRLHFLALCVFLLSILVILLLMSTLVHMFRYPASPLYFAADELGRLIRIVPISTPNMPTEDVVEWVIEGVEAAYSYDYVNYRRQLQAAEKYFTNYGWSGYMRALTLSNNLVALTQRKQAVVAQVIAPPKILTQGLLSGSYAWKMEMPLLVTYSSPPYEQTSQYSNALLVTVIVKRQKILEGYKGLGIVQLIAAFATTETGQQSISEMPGG